MLWHLDGHYRDLRVGEALRKSTKSSARLRDALDAMSQLYDLWPAKWEIDMGVVTVVRDAPLGLRLLNRPANVLTALMKQGVLSS